jgi:hypothetical protein
MSFEDDAPTCTSDFTTDTSIAKRQTGELAANSLRLTFLRIHLSLDAPSNLVIGDIVSI